MDRKQAPLPLVELQVEAVSMFGHAKIRRLMLTDESELALFGDVDKGIGVSLSSLWATADDKAMHRRIAVGYLTDEQAAIYNQRVADKLRSGGYNPWPPIHAGDVVVDRSCGWDIQLHNLPMPESWWKERWLRRRRDEEEEEALRKQQILGEPADRVAGLQVDNPAPVWKDE